MRSAWRRSPRGRAEPLLPRARGLPEKSDAPHVFRLGCRTSRLPTPSVSVFLHRVVLLFAGVAAGLFGPVQAVFAGEADVLVLGRISDDPKAHYGQLQPLLDYVGPRMADAVGYVFARSELNISTWVHKRLADAGAMSDLDWNNPRRMPEAFRRDMVTIGRTTRFLPLDASSTLALDRLATGVTRVRADLE